MAKNITEDVANFDEVLYESYNNEKNFDGTNQVQSFLDADKLVIVNHYNEINCRQVYKDIYNADLSFICEDSNLKKYVQYNEGN